MQIAEDINKTNLSKYLEDLLADIDFNSKSYLTKAQKSSESLKLEQSKRCKIGNTTKKI